MVSLNESNRREFLAQSAALAAATSLPIRSFAQETMRARRIPGTDEYLPVIGLGAPDIFIDLPPEGKELPISVLETMADLNKRPMDLLMIHNMRTLDEHWATLKDWKEAGRTRYIGVSLTRNDDYVEMDRFMRAERPDFIMTGYSIHHPLAAETTLPLAADLGMAVLIVEAFKTIDDGGIFSLVAGKPLPEWAADFDCESWAQFSLKFILSHPAVTGIVTETRQVRHVIDNLRAGYGRLPDEPTRQRMSEYLLSL